MSDTRRNTWGRRFCVARTALRVFPAAAVLILAGCSSSTEAGGGPEESQIKSVTQGAVLDSPSSLAVRPGTSQLWITNAGNDSLTVIDLENPEPAQQQRDGYGEHFMAHPSGIAFNDDGQFFAVSNNSNNEVRGLEFKLNPERETHFKGNNFMGPTLFSTNTFAIAGQNKQYMDDWPQPGISHDPPDDTPQNQCPAEYWSDSTARCVWPRQGSHLDMLHGNPLSAGIVHDQVNAFFVLDGCGARDDTNTCRGPGHVSRVDFNRDHQEGNGFHGDGTTARYIDLPFQRVDRVPSGMFTHDGWVYYSDTGAGVVRRFQPDSGTTEVMVENWNNSPASHGEHGAGVIDWSHIENGPGDGDDPATVTEWVNTRGNLERIAAAGENWIPPMETLSEYSYVWNATREDATDSGIVGRPSGLAAGEDSWFVADNENGRILEFGWDGTPRRVFETGKVGLTGLTLTSDGQTLIFADAALNGVYQLNLA
ncbi:hypothetical protein [Rhodococcus sp. IEGM 1379]|uniref:hypothetical protein n=1 Tax=Rhodococcus sp. IEGM 1379 TaxID=3047086 RepID=UPI0024B72EB9|nr:hypothetical protein [Rhodococcus sp. IEGM 1379]MDI9915836.1 hypothetical protein [Rhodococcus sp. IEGM 1379]